MSLKLKALGLGLIAALAMSAMAVVSATAETGGHFVSSEEHVEIKGEDVAANPPTLSAFGQTIACSESSYTATVSSATKTVTEITATPTYHACSVKSLGFPAHVNMNGCDYVFTVKKTNPQTTDNTTHLVCPGAEGPVITVTTGGHHCTLTVTPNITPGGGVAYTVAQEAGKPDHITMDVTVTGIHVLKTTGGFFQCGTFSSTDANGGLGGEATVKGFNTAGNQVSITAT